MNETTSKATRQQWQITAKLMALALILLPCSMAHAGLGPQKGNGKNMTRTNSGNEAGSEIRVQYRVVVDVSVEGQERWSGILRNIENLRTALGANNVEIEVVVYGKGLPLLVRPADNPNGDTEAQDFPKRISALAESGVRFVACENSMQRAKVTKEMLLPLVSTTDSGVAELVRKQHDGWAYLKPGS